MSKGNLIYGLSRLKPANNEQKYISYLNKDTNNDIHNELNKIGLQHFDVLQNFNKKKHCMMLEKVCMILKN